MSALETKTMWGWLSSISGRSLALLLFSLLLGPPHPPLSRSLSLSLSVLFTALQVKAHSSVMTTAEQSLPSGGQTPVLSELNNLKIIIIIITLKGKIVFLVKNIYVLLETHAGLTNTDKIQYKLSILNIKIQKYATNLIVDYLKQFESVLSCSKQRIWPAY